MYNFIKSIIISIFIFNTMPFNLINRTSFMIFNPIINAMNMKSMIAISYCFITFKFRRFILLFQITTSHAKVFQKFMAYHTFILYIFISPRSYSIPASNFKIFLILRFYFHFIIININLSEIK